MNLNVKILENEYWYGFRVEDCTHYPLHAGSDYDCYQSTENYSTNQEAPFLLSSKGRYIYCERAFDLHVKNGEIIADQCAGEPRLYEGYENLRGAFCAAAKRHFPADGKVPPKEFFTQPQYNTWIELNYHQNQADVLRYAQGILDNGLPPGILMIDDNWDYYYGKWEFDPQTFPDPRGMVDKLHEMGFSVMLWVCPFISPDSVEFRYLEQRGCLLKGSNGKANIRRWWNGNSAVLDLTNPEAVAWMRAQLDRLMEAYHIDGFKFDAGDVKFCKAEDVFFDQSVPLQGQCTLWAKLGSNYAYNEFRACFGAQGLPLVQRLSDKRHRWEGGVDLLVPSALTQSILGYPFGCPDMIGGGDYEDFKTGNETVDEELFVRYAQCAALMPMMQYSAAPWRILSPENAQRCIDAGKIHERWAERIYELACEAGTTGEPIIRYMEYVFPGEGMECVTDQFMVGDTLLVAPVLEKGKRERDVVFPAGTWKGSDGKVFSGPSKLRVQAPLDTLPFFEKINA